MELTSVCPNYPASKGEQCGPNIGSCSKGNCCSKYGYCGSIGLENADVYCNQNLGCQMGYGACFGSASNFCPSQQMWTTNVKPATREMSPTDKAEFDAKALEALAKSRDGSPGFIIGIWDAKKGFNMQAYGLSSWNGTKQTVDMHSFIGSVTKTTTAVAILQLVDQGILSLNQTVREMDLELAAKFPQIADITLERLLAMASGIPDYANDPQNSVLPIVLKDPQHYFTPNDLIAAGLAGNISKPGDTGYSTTNYIILGEILAKKTNKSPEEAVTDVYRALGMSESTLPAPEIFLPSPYTSGYFGKVEGAAAPGYNYSEFTLVNQWTRTWARSGGGAWSTLNDLKTYASSAFGNTLLSKQMGEQRISKTSFLPESIAYGPYGLGIFVRGDWIGHTGQLIGWESSVNFNLKDGSLYIALVDSSSGLEAADEVAKIYFPDLFGFYNPPNNETYKYYPL
jgi:D-alanyl-D-alanine carboxypeptidase